MAVRPETELALLAEYLTIFHEAVEGDEPLGRLLLPGVGGGEVQVDALELCGCEGADDGLASAGYHEGVGQVGLGDVLGRVGDAEGLCVHAEEEDIGLCLGGLDEEGALAAAQVQAYGREGGASYGLCRYSPRSRPGYGVELYLVAVALEALLEYEVLGQARVHSVHGSPFPVRAQDMIPKRPGRDECARASHGPCVRPCRRVAPLTYPQRVCAWA